GGSAARQNSHEPARRWARRVRAPCRKLTRRGFPDAARFRAASPRGPPGNHVRFGLNIHAPPNTNNASAPGRIATHRLTAAIAPALAQMIDESASAKVATREET